jgi:hypothetical protein
MPIYLMMTRVVLGRDKGAKHAYHTYTIRAESSNDALIKLEESNQFMNGEVIIGVSEIPDDPYLHYHLTGSSISAVINAQRGASDERKD